MNCSARMAAVAIVWWGALAAEAADEPVWHKDYMAARQLARTAGKPLFVVFRRER